MPRPCQRRRESAAAQRKSKPKPKPSGPPPIRHKARQKAIHNARHGRGRGGRPSRNQHSGNEIKANQDFISFASHGNNFSALNGAGSRQDPIALDEDDSVDDGEITDNDSDEDNGSDSDMYDADALTINVQVDHAYNGRPRRATVMFTVIEAMFIYRELHAAGFPLLRTTMRRYGWEEEDEPAKMAQLQPESIPAPGNISLTQYSGVSFKSDAVVGSRSAEARPHSNKSSYISPASSSMSRQPSSSAPTSHASAGGAQTQDAVRDYAFDWGVHSGKPFMDVPENYLRTIAANPVLLDKHPGVIEAFDFHRPGMRRTGPTPRQLAKQRQLPVQAPSRQGRVQGSRAPPKTSWTTFKLPSGAYMGKKLNEVPENYLRTIEGMAHVMNKWVGLKEALHDYNTRTGRQGKVAG